ncbi:MAG: response regulator transcription factor [Verrucomicrobiota bacterium]
MSKKKILLVDDHPLVREWLTNLINQEQDLVVSGAAESSTQALQMIQQEAPHLAVIDITLGEDSGIDLIKEIKKLHPEVKLIVLSMHSESLYAERALRAGAGGYVIKKESTSRIIEAIHQVLSGNIFLSEGFDGTLPVNGGQDARSIKSLSDRELEVFQMLGKGYETRKIGELLNISMNTVQVYCGRIKEKLKLNNATELLREAIRWEEGRKR